MCSLVDLPREVLLKIFDNLNDPYDRCRFSFTCKKLSEFYNKEYVNERRFIQGHDHIMRAIFFRPKVYLRAKNGPMYVAKNPPLAIPRDDNLASQIKCINDIAKVSRPQPKGEFINGRGRGRLPTYGRGL
jgi:hypothetical protein